MSCMRGWVALNGCGNTTTPGSGLYINSQPGISFKQLYALSDDEQKTVWGVWDDVEKRTDMAFFLSLNAQMSKRQRMLNPKHVYNLSRKLEGTVYAAGAVQSAGFTIKMNKGLEDYPVSRFAVIRCQSLSYYCHAADAGAEATVKIYDLISGDTLFEDEVELTEGWNEIPVNEVFHNNFSDNSTSLFACIEAASLKTTGKEVDTYYTVSDNALVFQGATSSLTDTITDDDVTEGSNSYGLTGIFSSECSWEALVCHNKGLFTAPWIYLLTVECLNEQLNSDRWNAYTTTKRERAMENRDAYQIKFDDALKQVCDSVDFSLSDACLECNEPYTLISATP